MYLKHILGINIGSHTSIHMGCFFTGRKISIGSNVVINRNCYLDGRYGIEIMDNVSISPECYILSLTHNANSSNFETIGKKVIILNYVWIGAKSMIMPGVIINNGAVIGAGSVVTKNVNSHEIVAGTPARKIGTRTTNLDYTLNYFPYFDTDID